MCIQMMFGCNLFCAFRCRLRSSILATVRTIFFLVKKYTNTSNWSSFSSVYFPQSHVAPFTFSYCFISFSFLVVENSLGFASGFCCCCCKCIAKFAKCILWLVMVVAILFFLFCFVLLLNSFSFMYALLLKWNRIL